MTKAKSSATRKKRKSRILPFRKLIPKRGNSGYVLCERYDDESEERRYLIYDYGASHTGWRQLIACYSDFDDALKGLAHYREHKPDINSGVIYACALCTLSSHAYS